MSLRGKTGIITGGGQGIGKAAARRFLSEGMSVVLAENDAEAGREAEAELRELGPVAFIQTNVADETSVKAMVAETVRRFGGVDALVNNAAISRGKFVTDLSLDEWNAVIGANLTGPFLCAKHCAPYLRERKGAIVNVASTRALMSEANTEAYSASKGGVVALTHSLAASLGPDVRVNCVCPGWIETGDWKKRSKRRDPKHSEQDRFQHLVGRVGVPDDIAEMIVYLISQKSGFITGANFVIDGGMTRKMIYV